MYKTIKKEAIKMLNSANSGTIYCDTYNKGFMDGINYMESKLNSYMKSTIKVNMSEIEDLRKELKSYKKELNITIDDFNPHVEFLKENICSLKAVNEFLDGNLILK